MKTMRCLLIAGMLNGANTLLTAQGGFNTETAGLPQGLSEKNLCDVSVTLGWDARPEGAYEVQYWLPEQAKVTLPLAANEVKLASLAPVSKYFWRMRAGGNGHWSAYTPVRIFHTSPPGSACAMPVSLVAMPDEAAGVTLSCQPVQGAGRYVFQCRARGAAAWAEARSQQPHCRFSALEPATGYEFRVRVECEYGSTPFSNVAFFTSGECVQEGRQTVVYPSPVEASGLYATQILPNPAESLVFIKSGSPLPEGAWEAAVLNIYGAILRKESGYFFQEETLVTLDLSGLPAGIYFLHLRAGGQTLAGKVLKN